MLSSLFLVALWSPTGKEELTSWLSFVMLYVFFSLSPRGILGQVWCLIVSILTLCRLSSLLFVMLSRLFIAALWSLALKELTSWLSFVTFNCVFVTSPM